MPFVFLRFVIQCSNIDFIVEADNQNISGRDKWEMKKAAKDSERVLRERKAATRRVILWGSVAVLLAGSFYGLIQLASRMPEVDTASVLTDALSPSDWTKGNSEGKVTLIEYSDFQCPACGAYYPLLKKLNEDLKDKIHFGYRHFPLTQIHKNAEPSAYAAEAAGKQGKFWEMHDKLFENQSEWSELSDARPTFIGYAESLGLDKARFESDMASGEVKDKVAKDNLSALSAKVNATPTFFLNGRKLQNPRTYDDFVQIINDAANAASSTNS